MALYFGKCEFISRNINKSAHDYFLSANQKKKKYIYKEDEFIPQNINKTFY